MDCSSPVPGIRSACSAISPSSSCGINSEPKVVANQIHTATNAVADPKTSQRNFIATSNAGLYTDLAPLITGLSFSLILPRSNTATAAGTTVSDSTMADNSAITTVAAMGWNIFPSTPVREKIGKYTTVMMATPNRLGRMTSLVASYTSWSRSRSGNWPLCWDWDNRRMQFSTIITAPSTIRPKSSAPRLIRLADTPDCTMPVMVASMDKGITAAVIRAARRLPSNRNSTTITSNAPSSRFFSTVAIALSTKVVRSYTASTFTPSGSEG